MEIPSNFFDVSFNKAMAFGYKTEDVDDFVTKAIQYIRDLQEENETLLDKMGILAQNLEKYREEEDSLRSALVGAQKLGDSILKECRNKAEAIMRDANARADQATMDAALEVERAEYQLNYLRGETADFKDKLFALYRTHLDMLKNLPEERTPVQRPTPPAAPVAAEIGSEMEQYAPTDPSYQPQETAAPEAAPPRDYDEEGQQYFADDDYTAGYSAAYDDPTESVQQKPQEFPEPEYFEEEPTPVVEEIDWEEEMSGDFEDDFNQQVKAIAEDVVEAVSVTQGIASYHPPQPREITEPPVRRPFAKPPQPQVAEDIFAPPPMVQMEFFDESEEDDDFAEDARTLRSVDMERIPFFDDEDEDEDFEVQMSPQQTGKRPFISQKFGEMKFGDNFKLNDD